MAAYYNEYDQKAAAWLRELIKKGHIADGVVDDRSIEDVKPTELAGFTQCHFFAGIGVWSYALRRAGWADDRPVWTGSCPCQPFSAAGKGAGFADERHLWPAFHHLISQCRPDIVLGEQVASKDGLGWLDLVQSDLEATGYASGAVDLCAAGVGAPHIRQRLWWVGTRLGNADNEGSQEHRGLGELHLRKPDRSDQGRQHIHTGLPFGMADSDGDRRNKSLQQVQGSLPERFRSGHVTEWLAETDSDGCGTGDRIRPDGQEHDAEHGSGEVGLADAKHQRWQGSNPGHGQELGADGGGAASDDAGHRADGGLADTGHLRGRDGAEPEGSEQHEVARRGGDLGGLADTTILRRGEGVTHDGRLRGGDSAEGSAGRSTVNGDLGSGLAYAAGTGLEGQRISGSIGKSHDGGVGISFSPEGGGSGGPSPTNGHWRDADWLFCRDGKWRPVEPGTSPLAHGSAARVGRLRGYGNAIVAQAAQAFIESVM